MAAIKLVVIMAAITTCYAVSEKRSASSCPASVAMTIMETWWGGFKASFTITALQDISSWNLLLSLSGYLDNVDSSWVATPARVSDDTWRLSSLSDNGNLGNGETLSNVFVVTCSTECATGNAYTATLTVEECESSSGSETTTSSQGNSGSTKNYTDALTKSILFYYAQRSGDLTGTYRPLSWVVTSATSDNPVGGWYDAGDYVKFNLPMAWSVMTQLWSIVQFKGGYQAAGQLDRVMDSLKWPLEYFLSCWDNDAQELVVQVGDGDIDHATWDRPQNMATPRPTAKVTTSSPGSDVAAEMAAALALGYLVFKDSDASFASSMLTAAQQIYTFGKTYQGKYSDSVAAAKFYSSTSYTDDLCIAAIWLKRATGDTSYLSDAQNTFYNSYTAWAFSWDSVDLPCQTLLYEETGQSQYKTNVENFFREWTGGSSVPQTPCGMVYRDSWGANRYAANGAFMALVAARDGIASVDGKDLNQFAVEQVNYLLGDNAESSAGSCFSFLIGYGDNFPLQPHHRAASCPTDLSLPCVEDDSVSNPNELTGALVGGPDQYDSYTDARSDYVQNEVAVDYNAGLQGALAGIVLLQDENNLPATDNNCKCE